MIGSGLGGLALVIEGFLKNDNGPIYRPYYRDAMMHLKMIGSGVRGIELVIDGFSKKGNEGTEGRRDGRTDPLIEM